MVMTQLAKALCFQTVVSVLHYWSVLQGSLSLSLSGITPCNAVKHKCQIKSRKPVKRCLVFSFSHPFVWKMFVSASKSGHVSPDAECTKP